MLSVDTNAYIIYGLPSRPNHNGYWVESYQSGATICSMNGVMGIKRRPCFFEGHEFGKGSKTNWNMLQYMLLEHCCVMECDHRRQTDLNILFLVDADFDTVSSFFQLDDWILCKVYEDLDPDELTFQLDMMDIG
ncbi:hypothetical protein ACH5RR_010655 [Cinchona calisaya]|uniref:NAC domain-containing protein n=1 Tax=Cinchona calisaya TaxID=153742 RepID=A0ABD3AJN9_9GENT